MTPPTTSLRNAAVRQLILNHRTEFDKIYIGMAKKAGTVYKYSKERNKVIDKQLKALSSTKKRKVRN